MGVRIGSLLYFVCSAFFIVLSVSLSERNLLLKLNGSASTMFYSLLSIGFMTLVASLVNIASLNHSFTKIVRLFLNSINIMIFVCASLTVYHCLNYSTSQI